MTIEGGGASSAGLIGRVKGILLTPKTEWDVIDNEPATVQSLYLQYAVILAAIPVVASLIGGQVFGTTVLGVTYRPPIVGGTVTAVVGYVLSLVSVGLLGFVINALAPSFDGTKDTVKAFKVAIYASTAGWIVGILNIVPMLGLLGILGLLYGCYLIYLGLPKLMNAPETKAVGYTVVTIIIAIVLNLLVGIVAAAVTAPLLLGANIASGPGRVSGNLTVPGIGSVDVDKLERAADQMAAAAENINAATGDGSVTTNNGAVVAADALQTLIPASLPGGFARTELSSASAGGIAAGANATFNRGDSVIRLNVVDAGPMGAMAGAFQVSSNRTTATGYEKMSTIDGRLTTEEYDRSNNHGKYSVMVGRFVVEASGDKITIGELKSAVNAVPLGRLEAMAKG